MAYTEEQTDRLLELRDGIEANREEYVGVTYRDTAALEEILGAIEEHTAEDEREDDLAMLRYLGDCYNMMGRHCISEKIYVKAVECAVSMGAEHLSDEDELEAFKSDIAMIAKLRNIYNGSRDSCDDIVELTAGLIGEAEARKTVDDAAKNVYIKYDPSEGTEEYLAVIDEVERQIDEELGSGTYMGKCHEIWTLKKSLLAAKGIEWHSLAEINGGYWD